MTIIKTIGFICLALLGVKLSISQEVQLSIVEEDIIVNLDSMYYSIKSDTFFYAHTGTLDIQLINNSDKRYIFANIPCKLSWSWLGEFREDELEMAAKNNYNREAIFTFSIVDDGQPLLFFSRSGYDACFNSNTYKEPDHCFYDETKSSNVNELLLEKNGYIAYKAHSIGLRKQPIFTILILEPHSEFKWTLSYDLCELAHIQGGVTNKPYKLSLLYYQGDELHLPDNSIPNAFMFCGLLKSNSINITFIEE